MDRLLQGDVGSGKTVVALYALLRAVESGSQGALMAPTETLAEQHFLTIEGLCAALGVRSVLLTSSLTGCEHAAARAALAAGEAQIAVGTHALIQEQVEFRRPRGRRGGRAAPLRRRAAPRARRGPRAAPAAHDGDADPAHARAHRLRRPVVSEIAKPPADRKPIVTAWVDRGALRPRRTRGCARHLDDGRQAYVVCPLIEESETSVRARPSRRPSGSSAASCAATASGCSTAGCGRPTAAS